MNSEVLVLILFFLATIAIAVPLGSYMSKVFKNEKTWLDFLEPIERIVFRLCGIDSKRNMPWRESLKVMLVMNFIFFVWAMAILLTQSVHPFWNPDAISNMEATTAFNTAVSFMTNTNLQHYSGESGASYLTQLVVFCFLQFVSAGTGIAVMALLFNSLRQQALNVNFYHLFLRSCTRILLPISIVVAIFLIIHGTPSTFHSATAIVTLQGDTIHVASGPVAPMVAIKQVGTNGGGFFGPNSTHPFENPDYLTNLIQNFSILIIPIALVFAFGFYIGRPRVGYAFFAAMTVVFVAFVSIAIGFEISGNQSIADMGINIDRGNMEGKEIRIGAAASAFWSVSTTSTSNGSVNSMHDSHMPISGGVYMLDMMINAIYGGVGVGFINFFVYVVIAVFIAGLLVGRTPELFGKKIEAKEVKIAALIAILHPFLILVGTAIAAHVQSNNTEIGWLANPSFHGFSEMLYEFTSSAANNGSGFEGLTDATSFWNILCGVVMLFGRFIPIIGPIAIGASLASKKFIPESDGTLKVDSMAFVAVLLSVIMIIAALSFFPALALGPLAEYFSI